ncbi:hypothetical protein FRC09_002671 [Ceratobasidium sp. 395]|nr:hypothetical protein FRC09_002671 [Ceratobasidium sp. 395]
MVFDEEETINHVILFMTDKAGTYYMDNVAPKPWEYDFNKLTIKLFEHCFPPDINVRLRRRFTGLKQTDQGLKDFIRALQKYQRRLSGLTDKQVARRIWEGAHSYLKIEWAKAGYSANKNTVEELEELGIQFKMAEKIRKAKEDKRKQRDNKDNKLQHPNRPAYRGESSTESNKITYTKSNKSNCTPRSNEKKDWKNKRNPKLGLQLTKEQMDQYHTAGRCFNCSEVGHTARDCPKRNQTRPTGLSTSSIRFAHIEELDNKHRGLEINHIHVDSESDYGNYEVYSEEEEEEEEEDAYSLEKKIKDQIDAYIELYATKVKKSKERGELERNAAMPNDFERKVARAIIVEMFVNGKSCRVLLDSGSLGNFISSTVVNQLRIKTEVLAKPMGLAMAVSGLRGVIKHSATVNIKCQDIDNTYCLDVANLDCYNLISGTTFMYRHSIMLGFNPESVLVRSNKPSPLDGPTIQTISSNATEVYEAEIEKIRDMLNRKARIYVKKHLKRRCLLYA